MRCARLLVLALVATTLSLVTASATALAEETCHGQAATIVGASNGPGIKGTPGNDVIVSNGEPRVEGGDGNDLICLTGTTPHANVQVEAGAGDDLVDATAATTSDPSLRLVLASLDAGADTYLGSPTVDEVDAQDDNGTPEAVDTVVTGAGDDHVEAGRKGVDTIDVISLGDGDDNVNVNGVPHSSGSVDGGVGTDTVLLADGSRAAWQIDNRAQTMTARGETMPATALEVFRVFLRDSRSIRFRGGAGEETLQIQRSGFKGDVQANMGAGRDIVYFWGPFVGGEYDGGRGADRIILFGHFVSSRLIQKSQGGADLAAGLVWLGDRRPRDHGQASVRSFVDLFLDEFGDSTVVGDGRANTITVKGCRSTVAAGGGDDVVTFEAWRSDECGNVSGRRIIADGEEGDDELTGSLGQDMLDGGPGLDHADGGKNVDSCVAEVRRRC